MDWATWRWRIMLLCGAATMLQSCREDLGLVPVVPVVTFSGITATDYQGNVLSVDTADWKPIAALGIVLRPAYPNPCSISFTVAFTMPGADSISITVNSTPSVNWETIAEGVYGKGEQLVLGNAGSLPSGIYRVYFNAFRNGITYTTFGDIQVAH